MSKLQGQRLVIVKEQLLPEAHVHISCPIWLVQYWDSSRMEA